jgi:putative ABC transport system substrate-binding protein
VIGFLHGASPGPYAPFLPGFHQGLKEGGYTEGRNVAVEYHWAEDRYNRLPALAADLVDRHVTVIAAPGSTPAALAAKGATRTIPIVFLVGGDQLRWDWLPVAAPQLQELQIAARELGLQLHVLNASTEQEIDTAFATVVQLRAGGLVIVPDAFFASRSKRLAALALRHAIPTIPEFTAAGGLMSYGATSAICFV